MVKFSSITCGLILLAGAGAASATPIQVALVSTIGNPSFEQDVVSKIEANSPFLNVVVVDAKDSTPTVSALEGYQAIMVVVGNNAFKDGVALGNNIDTYLNDGY